MQQTRQTLLTLIAAALVLAPVAMAAEYEFETLDVGPAFANDVNNRGQVVGNVGPIGLPLRRRRLHPHRLPGYFAECRTWAFGINEHGIIVGRYLVDDEQHGFVYDQGAFTTVDYPGAPVNSWAFSINNRGDILGLWCEDDASPTCQFNNATEDYHGYLLDKNGFSVIDFPGAADTYSLDINDRGAIVGQYYDAGGTGFAFELDKGRLLPHPRRARRRRVRGPRDHQLGRHRRHVHQFRRRLPRLRGRPGRQLRRHRVSGGGAHPGGGLERPGGRDGDRLHRRLHAVRRRRPSGRRAVAAEPGRAIEAGLERGSEEDRR